MQENLNKGGIFNMPTKWLSKEKCINLLSKEIYGRLGTCGDDKQPYITPINFVIYNEKMYFHTGFKGRKLDNIGNNHKVCLEVSGSGKHRFKLNLRETN